MAKYVRTVIGSIIKSKSKEKPDYIKFKTDVSFKAGDCISVETKSYKLVSLENAYKKGYLNQEMLERLKEKVEKMPEFVRADLVKVTKK